MHITKEQKELANQVDLVDYLSSKGYEFKRFGSCYKLKIREKGAGDMSSLSIFENRRGWKRWSTGEHGGDAISFLQVNMGMSFQDAVLELIGGQALSSAPAAQHRTARAVPPPAASVPDKPAELVLPKKCEGKFSRLFAYLTKTRMIDAGIVSQMIAEKKIYQDDHHNAVFVGFDEQQQAKFACVRGTNTNVPYKGDCIGSDKRYAFSMEGTNKTKLYVFEAPIDLLSHATLTNRIVNHPQAWTVHSRVCLAGTSDVALEHFLKTHPEIKELHFYLDNDPPGRDAAIKHCRKYAAMGYEVHNYCPKYNDMNDELIAHVTKKPPPAAQQKAVGMKR